MTVGETAELLRVTPRTVRRLVADRQLPALRVGGQIRVSPTRLEQWLDEREEQR